MNNITVIELSSDFEPRIHMRKFPMEPETLDYGVKDYPSVYGALHFVECEFIGMQYGEFSGTEKNSFNNKLYFYKHNKHGILFCDERMRFRISERLEANGHPALEYEKVERALCA